MDWAFLSKWTGLKLSFGFRKNRQQPKQGKKKKFAWQILEFSLQKKLGKEELKVELVKSSEKQGEKNLLRKFWNFPRRKNLEKKN